MEHERFYPSVVVGTALGALGGVLVWKIEKLLNQRMKQENYARLKECHRSYLNEINQIEYEHERLYCLRRYYEQRNHIKNCENPKEQRKLLHDLDHFMVDTVLLMFWDEDSEYLREKSERTIQKVDDNGKNQ